MDSGNSSFRLFDLFPVSDEEVIAPADAAFLDFPMRPARPERNEFASGKSRFNADPRIVARDGIATDETHETAEKQRQRGAFWFHRNESPRAFTGQREQFPQRFIIELMQQQIHDDHVHFRKGVAQKINRIGRDRANLPVQFCKLIDGFRLNDLSAIHQRRLHERGGIASPEMFGDFEEKQSIAAAQIDQLKRLGGGQCFELLRQDFRMAHDAIEPQQIRARAQGFGIVRRQNVEQFGLDDAGHGIRNG